MDAENILNNNIPSEPTKIRKITKILLLVFFVILILISFGCILVKNYQKQNNIQNSNYSQQILDDYGKKIITDDTVELLMYIGINAKDKLFNLDFSYVSEIKSILGNLNSQSGPVSIFNGQVFGSDLVLSNNAQTYYIHPAELRGQYSEYLKLIEGREISFDDFLKSTPSDIDKNIYSVFYNAYHRTPSDSDDKIYQLISKELNQYLDSQISAGIIVSYNYNLKEDILSLNYPNSIIVYELQPLSNAKITDFGIKMYAEPAVYANNILKDYNQRLNQGDVLIANSKDGQNLKRFIGREEILNVLATLSDDSLSVNDKIDKLAGNIRPVNPDKLQERPLSTIISPLTVWAESLNLLDNNGIIVSPAKDFYYFDAPDYMFNTIGDETFSGAWTDLKNPQGSFSVFYQNNYIIRSVRIYKNNHGIETFDRLLSDSKINNLYISAHGGGEKILIEIYDLGHDFISNISPEFLESKDYQIFEQRVKDLKNKYGADSILGTIKTRPAPNEGGTTADSILDNFGLSGKNIHSYGAITVTDKFFEKQMSKKSIFILLSCYGGSLADNIKARVMLAVSPDRKTNGDLFVSDLKKIGKYLIKDPNFGDVQMDNSNHRNYNTLSGFLQKQVKLSLLSSNASYQDQDNCIKDKDSLCTIFLYGSGPSVAVSPHVESASVNQITFNAPMDTNVQASDVVSVDTTQCDTSNNSNQTQINWADDKSISISGLDSVTRDWDTASDFNGNTPKVPVAIITVKNDKAVSTESLVRLTGNTDACNGNTCINQASYLDPAAIKYNGNHPNTDFVFIKPCINNEFLCLKQFPIKIYWRSKSKNQIIYTNVENWYKEDEEKIYEKIIDYTDANKIDYLPRVRLTIYDKKTDTYSEYISGGYVWGGDRCIRDTLTPLIMLDQGPILGNSLKDIKDILKYSGEDGYGWPRYIESDFTKKSVINGIDCYLQNKDYRTCVNVNYCFNVDWIGDDVFDLNDNFSDSVFIPVPPC